MEAVQKMPSWKFNKEQCQYLGEKLQVVVRSARSFFELFCARFNNGPGSSEDMGRCVEIFKLLVALSKQIESFFQGCCKDTWIQAAMTLTNVSEYVSSLGFNLELCGIAIGTEEDVPSRRLTIQEVGDIHKGEAKVVKRKASADLDNLLAKVTQSLTEKSLSREEDELARYLLQRLHRVKPKAHHVPLRSPWRSMIPEGGVLEKLVNLVTQMDKLGKGTSGTVHRAMWLGTLVAKKTFPVRSKRDFETETKILAELCHPNITSMFCSYATADHEKSCSIIMELMDEDLHDLIERRHREMRSSGNSDSPPFTLLEAVDIMLQVGEGVNYLHNLRPSIVHRDLKSANILVKCVAGKESESGYVHDKVADFGFSETLDSSERFSEQPTIGTNRWMAPEIINLDGNGNQENTSCSEVGRYPQKTDVFSFGMVCYEIITGHEPFENDAPNLAKKKVKKGDRPKLPKHCPKRLKDLIVECWSEDPRKRPTFDIICSKLRHLKYY